ncbi:MAG: ATP-binding protein, partial [Tepidisphaeraceae bacterium]
RKQAELEVTRQRSDLVHLSRVTMLGELSGSLAHELNQPLAAILSNAQAAQRFLARGDSDPEEIEDILRDIVNDDKRAGEIIQRLRLLLTKGEIDRRPLDINELARDVLRLMRSDLVSQSVVVETDFAPDLHLVSGDRVQLQQVLLNLIMNACDSMAGNNIGNRLVVVRTRMENQTSLRISVIDQGIGIPADNLHRVFEPFVSTKKHGMGLGLSVCRTIIFAHGGHISAANNPERGATFDVILRVEE